MDDKRVIDRLLQYLSYKGLSNSAAEKQLGLANAYLKNTSKDGRIGSIGSDILARISETFLDLRLMWLITGRGEMLQDLDKNRARTPDVEPSIIDGVNSNPLIAPPYGRPKQPKKTIDVSPTTPENVSPTVSPTLNMGAPHVVTVDHSGQENIVMVPLRARAGYLLGYGDPEYIQTLPTYSIPGHRNRTFRAFEVEGHSMSPTLKNHDVVIGDWVESLDDIRDDRIYVIVTKNKGIVVKRVLNRISEYGFLVAKSDSVTNRHEYPNLQIHPEDVLELWYARTFISSDFRSPSEGWQRLNDLEAGFEYLKSKLESLNL